MVKSTRLLGVTAIAVAASALALLVFHSFPHQSRATAPALRGRSTEGHLVRHELRTTTHEGPRASISPAAAQAPVATDTAPDAERKRQLKALHQAQLQLYATTFTQEAVDASWASGAEAGIRTVLGRVKQPVTAAQVRCKRTLCRVDLNYEEPREGHAVLQWMLMDHPWPGVVFTRNDAERHSAIAYYARQGHELPKVAPATLTL